VLFVIVIKTADFRQQLAVGSWQTAGVRQQTADSGQQTSDSRPQTADSSGQLAVGSWQTADRSRQLAVGRQQTADGRQQTSDAGAGPHPRLLSAVGYLLSIAVIPILVDGGTQAIGLRESTNPLRLATGLTVGAAFGLWVLVSIETRARQRFAPS
jgi:hypothetical protein